MRAQSHYNIGNPSADQEAHNQPWRSKERTDLGGLGASRKAAQEGESARGLDRNEF